MIKIIVQGFTGGSTIKNMPANAGDTDSIPGPRRSHMPGATGPVYTTAEPMCPEACALQQKNPPQ